MFTFPYLGGAHIALLEEISKSSNSDAQERFFIAVTQATCTGRYCVMLTADMTLTQRVGKTRMLLEVSKLTPLIVVRLDPNPAYDTLLRLCSVEATRKALASLEALKTCHQRILLYIRYFFYAYLKYTQLFLGTLLHGYGDIYCSLYNISPAEHHHQPPELRNVNEGLRNLFNASLLNGGLNIVNDIFLDCTKHVGSLSGDALESAIAYLQHDCDELAHQLGCPHFAVDECHRPYNEVAFHGYLLHFNESPDDPSVLAVHQYEVSLRAHSHTTSKPENYKYEEPTTLMSGFREVLTQFLTRNAQVSVFASTYFAIWEPLIGSRSRGTPTIKQFHQYHELTLNDIRSILRANDWTEEILDTEQVKEVLAQWCGRVGFFVPHFFHYLQGKPRTNSALLDTHMEGKRSVFLRLKQQVNTQPIRRPGMREEQRMYITMDQVVNKCCASMRICGGNLMNPREDEFIQLVEVGYALVSKGAYTLKESLVKQFLMEDYTSYERADKYIAAALHASTAGTGFGEYAEWAIINQILTYDQRPILTMLKDWGCEIPNGPPFAGVTLLAKYAASVDDLRKDAGEAYQAYVEQAPRITRPRTGLSLPDGFGWLTNSGAIVGAWAAQFKAERRRLAKADFCKVVQNIST